MELFRLFKRTVQYIDQNGTFWKYEHRQLLRVILNGNYFVCLNAQYNI